jgi:hypothetical protein
MWEQSRQVARLELLRVSALASDRLDAHASRELTGFLERAERDLSCLDPTPRTLVPIQARATELALERRDADSVAVELDRLIFILLDSLSCAPSQSYAWLMLFWVYAEFDELQPAHFAFLDMSYRTGPREAWVARKRVEIMFDHWAQLPAAWQQKAVAEFRDLASRSQATEMAAVYATVDEQLRDRLRSVLFELPDEQRRRFVDLLRDNVPLLAAELQKEYELRPRWQR